MADHLTNIEEIYRVEIFIIRICGGMMFDWSRTTSAIYRLMVVIAFKLYTLRFYFKYINLYQGISKTSVQNTRLFITSYYLAFNLATIVSIISGVRYHRLILILLKKRLDTKYLHPQRDTSDDNEYISETKEVSSRYVSNNQHSDQPTTRDYSKTKRISKTCLARQIFFLNLLLSILSMVFREFISINRSLKKLEGSDGESDYWIQIKIWFSHLFGLTSSNLFILAAQASINIISVYGQPYVVFLIVATLTDMLNFACKHDNLDTRRAQQRNLANHTTPEAKSNDSNTRDLLTSELLVQAREVLISIRCAMNLDYLMSLISDITRLMVIFCLFIESLGNREYLVTIAALLEYLRTAFNMLTMRVGYHWLHSELRMLKRYLDEQNLLNIYRSDELNDHSDDIESYQKLGRADSNSSIERRIMTQPERIKVYRLATEIEGIWPTEWFIPDLKTFLSQNLLVITLVATLQQLVEVNTRVEYRSGGPKAVSSIT